MASVLTWFDYVIMAIVLLSVIFGLMKGLLREIVTLLSLFLSIVLAFRFAEMLSVYVPWWQSPTVRYIAAFIAIVLTVLVVGMLIGLLLKNTAKTLGLGALDHGLGAVFGLIRGSLVALVMVFLVANTGMASQRWYKQSMVTPWFNAGVLWLEHYFPVNLQAGQFANNAPKHLDSAHHMHKKLQHQMKRLHHKLQKA